MNTQNAASGVCKVQGLSHGVVFQGGVREWRRACLVEAPGCQVVVQSLAVRQRVAGDALAGVEDVLAQAAWEAVGQVVAQALQVQRQALVEVLHRGARLNCWGALRAT